MRSSFTIVGHVGRDINRVVSKNNVEYTTFSLAHTPRRRTAAGEWVDETTQWYNVRCFGELGANVAASLHKGCEVIVTGRLEVRSWEGDKGRMAALDIIADAVGISLRRGEVVFRKVKREDLAVEAPALNGSQPGAEPEADPEAGPDPIAEPGPEAGAGFAVHPAAGQEVDATGLARSA